MTMKRLGLLLALCGLAGSAAAADARKKNVAIVVYDKVELLDFAGPGEVFRAAGDGEAFNVYTVATSHEPILSFGFVTVTPQYSIDDSPAPDILVMPGGNSNVPLQDPKLMAWLAQVTRKTELTFSVCTGAFVLARLGLLEGRAATTHWASLPRLRSTYPALQVLENRRFVDADQVVTTAGVSAGIDGALHVVDRLLGRTAAWKTARYMEYDWRPEGGGHVAEARPSHVP